MNILEQFKSSVDGDMMKLENSFLKVKKSQSVGSSSNKFSLFY